MPLFLANINCGEKSQNQSVARKRAAIRRSSSTSTEQTLNISSQGAPSNLPVRQAREAASPKAGEIEPTDEFAGLRDKMVKYQLENRGVTNKKVLNTMRKVPRHLFIPERNRDEAYADHPVSIGKGQTISQPYIVGLMTELLDLKSTDKVLEIGAGSGYQAAILADICREVYTIEIIEDLGKKAERLLLDLGYKNIKVKIGDGYLGWPEKAAFDAIIVTCAPENIPEPLIEQLAEGGRMVIPVGDYPRQTLKRITKRNGKLNYEDIIAVLFVPMTGKAQRIK